MKLRSLWNRNLQQDLDDELQSHIELKAEELEAQGLSPAEALLEARRRFGNITATKEKTRDMHVFTLLENLWHDARYAVRRLLREPTFTVTAILTLALVIGANGAIFSLVEAVLLRPLPYPEPDRLVALYGTDGHFGRTPIAAPDLDDLRASRSLSLVAAEQTQSVNLTGVEEPGRLIGSFVSSSYFPILGVQAGIGRVFGAREDQPGSERVCLLSYAVWRDRFGSDQALVGRPLILNAESYTVIGVLPESFRPKFTNAEVWLPVQYYPNYSRDRARLSVTAIARLADGISLQQAQAEIDTIAKQLAAQYPGTHRTRGIAIHRVRDLITAGPRETLLVLAGAAGCVLLIGCANIASLLLTKALTRKHEIAVRSSLGAGRARLARQLLTESLVLAAAGGALGVAFAYGGMQLIIRFCGDLAARGDLEINGTVLLFLAAISLVTGLLFGTAPAAFAQRQTASLLRQKGVGGGPAGLRNVLVTAQVGFAMALLIGAGLMLKSVRNIASIDPGFRGERVLTMEYRVPRNKYPTGAQQTQFHHEVAARVSALPGVESAALVGALPFSGNENTMNIALPGRPEPPPESPISVQTNPATPGYFSTVGIKLLSGRDFTLNDGPDAQPVSIVSKSFAERFWPRENALGRQVTLLRGDTRVTTTIIGVVGNTKHNALDDPETVQLYQPFAQAPFIFATLTVKAHGDPSQLTRSVQQAIWSIDKDQPMWKIRTLQSLVDRSFSFRRYMVYLLGAFSLLAVGLAAVGIFGVLSYAVAQRTAEFGIRAAIGATPGDILRLVLRNGALLTTSGLAAGFAMAFILTKYLTRQVYGVSITDPLVYASVATLLLVVALVAVAFPARRAMRVDPVVALRQE